MEETGDVVALCFGSKAFLANEDGGSARRRRRTSKTDAHVDVYGLVANERAPMDDEGRDCRSTPPTAAHRCAPMESPTVAHRS